MNKTKMMLAVIGGVIALAVLVMAYFAWSAFAAKTAAAEGDDEEGTDGLETVMEKAQKLSRLTANHPVYPCGESLKAIQAKQEAVVAWKEDATKLATRGDRVFSKTTPAAFKTFIVGDAKRLATLPGAVSGVLVKPDFAFGPFREYIVEGKMPTEAQLAELQRRWDDVATVIELLSQSGIAELTDVQYQVADTKAAAQDAKGKKKVPQAKNKANAPVSDISNPSAYTYVFSFTTKPAGFANVLNKLVTSERFIAVDGFTFSRTRDALSEALGGEEKKEASVASGGRRGRRRGAVQQQEKKEDAAKKSASSGIVTDPLLEEPVAVVLTVTVNDFHSLEERRDEATAPAEKKGASK